MYVGALFFSPRFDYSTDKDFVCWGAFGLRGWSSTGTLVCINSTGPLLPRVKASRLPAIDVVLLMELRRGAGGRVEGEVLLEVCVRSTGGTVDVPCIRVVDARFFHGWMIENEKFVDGGLSQ